MKLISLEENTCDLRFGINPRVHASILHTREAPATRFLLVPGQSSSSHCCHRRPVATSGKDLAQHCLGQKDLCLRKCCRPDLLASVTLFLTFVSVILHYSGSPTPLDAPSDLFTWLLFILLPPKVTFPQGLSLELFLFCPLFPTSSSPTSHSIISLS